MHRRTRLPEDLLALAKSQSGVLSRDQALAGGLSRDAFFGLTRNWIRLAHGIYLVTPTFEAPPFTARVWAGVLLGGTGARVAGTTAALLQGLADHLSPDHRDAGTHRDPAAVIDVLVPGCSRRPQAGFRIHREEPGHRVTSDRREPPRTRIEDTVLDLCAEGSTQEEVITWLTRAHQRRLTTPDRLSRRLAERRALRNRRLIQAVLADVATGVTSHLEHEAVARVFRPHGLPAFRLQARTGATGRIADAAFERYRVLIELDGRLGHVEEGMWRDRIRDNAHTAQNWVTLRFGWWEVLHDPCAVAAQISQVLIARGWDGTPDRCSNCRNRRGPEAFVG